MKEIFLTLVYFSRININKIHLKAPFSEGGSGASVILSPDLVKDLAPSPQRGGGPGVLAGGDGDGLPLLACHHVKVDLDQSGRSVRSAGTSTKGGV